MAASCILRWRSSRQRLDTDDVVADALVLRQFASERVEIVADRFFASSKLHATCGYTYKELKLADREWTCPNCKKWVDRDLNAARIAEESCRIVGTPSFYPDRKVDVAYIE